MNIFLLKDRQMGKKLTRGTWDYVPVMTQNVNPGGRCIWFLTLFIALGTSGLYLRKKLVWLVLTLQSNEATLKASVVAVKPYSVLYWFINKVDKSLVKYSRVWGGILSVIWNLKIWFWLFSKILYLDKKLYAIWSKLHGESFCSVLYRKSD